MAQHDDYVLDNDTGANFRSDLNDYVAALRTTASGTVAPVNPVAGQFWVDTSASPVLLKLRDSTNTLWVTIYDITNDEGILAATATNATSVGGVSASAGAVASTIAKNTGTGGLDGDIIGNITGYVGTVVGDTAADILDLTTRTAHKQLDFVDSLSSIYSIAGASISTQSATTGDDAVLSYTIDFTGDVTVKAISTRSTGLSSHNFYIAVNGTQESASWAASDASGTITTREYDLTDLEIGDTIELRSTWGAATSTNVRAAHMQIYVSTYGLYSDIV